MPDLNDDGSDPETRLTNSKTRKLKMKPLGQCPYHYQMIAAGAQMVDRLGIAAPLVYSTTEEEHLATRNGVGLFDVYYQVAVEVSGAGALDLLQYLCVNNIATLMPGRSIYTSLCNEQGGMIDDLTVFCLEPTRYWLCPTPSRAKVIADWLQQHATGKSVSVTNLGYKNAFLSVQGPKSRDTLAKLTQADLSAATLPYFGFIHAEVAGIADTMVSRTGYSGELGFELFYPSEYAAHMWDAVMQAGAAFGIRPCGLGALRSLRIEKKYPLYGLDIDETTSPYEAGLGWTVKLDKGRFVGADALRRQRDVGASRTLVAIRLPGTHLVAIGDTVVAKGIDIAVVRSAERGYAMQATFAMAYIPPALALAGTEVQVRTSGINITGFVETTPPYDPKRRRMEL